MRAFCHHRIFERLPADQTLERQILLVLVDFVFLVVVVRVDLVVLPVGFRFLLQLQLPAVLIVAAIVQEFAAVWNRKVN